MTGGERSGAAGRAVEPARELRLAGFDGRLAVVTGIGSGIGRATAEALRALGARVAGIDLEAGSDDRLVVAADVADEAEVDEAFTTIERELGRVDMLVTSAGLFRPLPVDEITGEAWRRTIDVNLGGTFHCARRALPGMRANGFGRVVTLSSAAGLDGGTMPSAHYAASKGGVIALTKALATETAADGVTVNCVAPRDIRTPMLAGLDLDPSAVPVGRLGEADDVAAAIAFLCSAHAAYVTGEVFVLNGGRW